ncbi:MAG: DUF4760 domain-containing protein [Gallionella sp.]
MIGPNSGTDEVRAECESLGEFQVEAFLDSEKQYFHGKDAIARAWLLKRRAEAELNQYEKGMRWTRWTAYASWALAFITFILAIGTLVIGQRQLQDSRETREQQSKDAKELLRVQVSIELDKEFDSLEMRRARRTLAAQLLNKTRITEDRVPDFFEKLGMYMYQDRIDEDTVYNDFSGMVEMYWPALKQFVIDSRREDQAPDEYTYFEKLYHKMIDRDVKESGKTVTNFEPSHQEINSFLHDEFTLPK